MPTKSWCHDLENSCFLGNVLLYSLASTLSFEEDHFRRFNHSNKTLTVLPYPSDRNTVSGSEPTLSRTSCSPSTVCFLFIHWHNSWTKLPPNDWRPSTDSDWRLNWTYTLKPQTPTVILDLVTAVCWMCRYWKWLTKLFRRLSSDIYVIMLTHLYVDTGSW